MVACSEDWYIWHDLFFENLAALSGSPVPLVPPCNVGSVLLGMLSLSIHH